MKDKEAFPVSEDAIDTPGMTLRDYFAAKAMQGLLANPKLADEIRKNGGARGGWIENSAFAFADSMLEAREAK